MALTISIRSRCRAIGQRQWKDPDDDPDPHPFAKRALAVRGMMESVSWSFIGGTCRLFGGGSRELRLANPIAADMSDMRPSLLPGLLAAAQRNADRGIGDVALFEVGHL
jgi:phenylalanyl-tRNA synthetase beta subunit